MFTIDSNPPAPAPCTALPAMSITSETAAPQRALPRKKTAAADWSTNLRPQMSLNLPQLGVEAAAASMNAEPTQMYPDVDSKWSAMVGSAVVTMVTSRAAMNTESWGEW